MAMQQKKSDTYAHSKNGLILSARYRKTRHFRKQIVNPLSIQTCMRCEKEKSVAHHDV